MKQAVHSAPATDESNALAFVCGYAATSFRSNLCCHDTARLCTGAKIVGLSLGHVAEALHLISTAHVLLADANGRSKDRDLGASGGGGAQRDGEEAMAVVVELTMAEARLHEQLGDYNSAYANQTSAIELLTVLSQSAPASAANTSLSPAPAGTDVTTAGGCTDYDSRITEATAACVAMARELGRYDEGILMCKRTLLTLSLKRSIPEPAPLKHSRDWRHQEEISQLNLSSPFRSPTRTPGQDSEAEIAPASEDASQKEDGTIGVEGVDEEMPPIAMIRRELGKIYLGQGKLEEALAEARRVMHTCAREMGEAHPRTADAMDEVGVVLAALERHSAAADMHRHALARREQCLGVQSVAVAVSLEFLARAREGEGKLEEARQLRQRCVDTVRARCPDGHPHVAEALVCLAGSERAAGDLESAQEMLNEAYHMWVSLHGRAHPKVAVVLSSLALLSEERCEYDKALLLHEQSLEVKRSCLGRQHQAVSTTLVHIARVREKLGDLAAAVDLREKALGITRARSGAGHPQVAAARACTRAQTSKRTQVATASTRVGARGRVVSAREYQ